MRVTKRNLALGFAFLLLLLGINAAISYFNTQRLIESNRWVTHTYRVVTQLDAQLSYAQDVETGARGFIITGNDKFLEPYRSGLKGLDQSADVLALLVRDNKPQQARAMLLKKQLQQRAALATLNVVLRRTQGFEAAQRKISQGGGKRAMDAIRATIGQMKGVEFRLLNLRQKEATQSARTTLLSLVIFALSGVILLSLIYSNLARAELRKVELQHAYTRLRKLEEMRDGLTAMLVHDLRTPLTTLLGPLEMLESGGFGQLDETQSEIVGMSTRSGYRLLGLVNELLDISKMEAGEMKVRRETVQAHVVVDGAIRQVLRADQMDDGRIAREIQPALPLMQADEELLIRVLINLLGNALKFTPSDSKVMVGAREAHTNDSAVQAGYRKVRAISSADNSSKRSVEKRLVGKPPADASQEPAPVILFSVQDEGEGIPETEQARIFEKFGQVESRQEGRKMSTGLGLTFCKLAVEAHGGHIWVESEINKGSTFYFTVPLRPWLQGSDNVEKAQAAAAAT